MVPRSVRRSPTVLLSAITISSLNRKKKRGRGVSWVFPSFRVAILLLLLIFTNFLFPLLLTLLFFPLRSLCSLFSLSFLFYFLYRGAKSFLAGRYCCTSRIISRGRTSSGFARSCATSATFSVPPPKRKEKVRERERERKREKIG